MRIRKNGLVKLALCTALICNVVLGVGVFVAYHTGYESGVQSGIDIGSALTETSTETGTSATVISSEGVLAETRTGITGSPDSPSAGITLQQTPTPDGYTVTLQLAYLDNANSVRIVSPSGDCDPCHISHVGESLRIQGLSEGDSVTALAMNGQYVALIEPYIVTSSVHEESAPQATTLMNQPSRN